jgi:hypothetical protein
MLAELVDSAADLAGCEDALEAELAGALFVAMAVAGGDDTLPAFAQAFIPAIEARGNDAALMMLTAIGAAACGGPEQVAQAAVAAAGRPAASGVPAPGWARELEQPLRAGHFTRLYDTEGTMSVLVGSFHRAAREHAVMVVVDHDDCGAAEDIFILDAADLPVALKDIRDGGRRDGLTIKTQRVPCTITRTATMTARTCRSCSTRRRGPGTPCWRCWSGYGWLLCRSRVSPRARSCPGIAPVDRTRWRYCSSSPTWLPVRAAHPLWVWTSRPPGGRGRRSGARPLALHRCIS